LRAADVRQPKAASATIAKKTTVRFPIVRRGPVNDAELSVRRESWGKNYGKQIAIEKYRLYFN